MSADLVFLHGGPTGKGDSFRMRIRGHESAAAQGTRGAARSSRGRTSVTLATRRSSRERGRPRDCSREGHPARLPDVRASVRLERIRSRRLLGRGERLPERATLNGVPQDHFRCSHGACGGRSCAMRNDPPFTAPTLGTDCRATGSTTQAGCRQGHRRGVVENPSDAPSPLLPTPEDVEDAAPSDTSSSSAPAAPATPVGRGEASDG